MGGVRQSTSESRRVRRAGWWRAVLVALLVVVVAGGGLGGAYWWWQSRTLEGMVGVGLKLLRDADDGIALHVALANWERRWDPPFRGRRLALARHLVEHHDLGDGRVRVLLTRVTGAYYGTDKDAWRRWLEDVERRDSNRSLSRSRAERVKLELLWSAPVGLTGWFSAMLALDGRVYVASLGADFVDPADVADGVVVVDGASGQAALLFTPPPTHYGPGGMIGIAGGSDVLFAASQNGVVYCIDRSGTVRWSTHTGAPIVSAPLAVDTNHDGVRDVVVVTQAGKVVALSGHQGATTWVATLTESASVPEQALGATLALGDLLGDADEEILATAVDGAVVVLDARNGRRMWRGARPAGILGGSLCRGSAADAGPPAFVLDRSARVWGLVRSGGGLQMVAWPGLGAVPAESAIAGLRSLNSEPERPPALVAFPTGDYAGGRGALGVVRAEGLEWRCPVGGAVWATPAVANLNREKGSEVVLVAIEPRAGGVVGGVLTVVSPAGHMLLREELPAPVESAPLVADVTGDGRLELLVADQTGRLHCYMTGAAGPVEWGSRGGDKFNTLNEARAYEFGQVPFGLQWSWTGE